LSLQNVEINRRLVAALHHCDKADNVPDVTRDIVGMFLNPIRVENKQISTCVRVVPDEAPFAAGVVCCPPIPCQIDFNLIEARLFEINPEGFHTYHATSASFIALYICVTSAIIFLMDFATAGTAF